MNDRILLDRLRSGDREAYVAAGERFSREIWAYVYRMCGDAELSSDICQETAVALWRAAPQFPRIEYLRAWVYRVAHNAFVDSIRKSRLVTTPLDEALSDSSACAEPDPTELMVNNEALRLALNGLPENIRASVLLTKVHGMTCREVGIVLNAPTGTVKWWVSEGLKALRKALAEGEEQ